VDKQRGDVTEHSGNITFRFNFHMASIAFYLMATQNKIEQLENALPKMGKQVSQAKHKSTKRILRGKSLY
jgi:hypothetical protein